MNHKELAEKLVAKCLKLGADHAEVYVESSRNLSIQTLKGEIETIEEASSLGVGFRVFLDGRMGFSHCNDLGNRSLEETIKRAVAFARLTTPDDNNVLADNMGFTEVAGLYDPEIVNIPMEQKIKMTIDLEAMSMKDPRITKSSGSGYGESESEVFIANSMGLSKSFKSSGCSIGVSVVAEKDDQKNTGGEYCSRRFFADLVSLEEIAVKASRKAWEMIDPVMIKTQRAAVIFEPEVGRSLLGGVIAALDGERVLQGASFLKDSMGTGIATENLTIIDDGTTEKGLGSRPFDGEGVPTQKRTLVEKGTLKGFLYNTSVAKRAGVTSTGNASRNGFTSLPGIGTHNIIIPAGTMSRNEIIAATPRGLLVKGVTGYGINPVTGNFSGGATGFWVEKGEIVHPVKGLTIAGTASDILNNLDMLGNDLDLSRSFASPTFRISEMQIGGL